jgi:hypothetical protein
VKLTGPRENVEPSMPYTPLATDSAVPLVAVTFRSVKLWLRPLKPEPPLWSVHEFSRLLKSGAM